MENKEVKILCYCDRWHSTGSYRIIACFDNSLSLERFILKHKEEFKLTPENIQNLTLLNQTQGLGTNLIVLTERLNPTEL